jgi:hypothetical protein
VHLLPAAGTSREAQLRRQMRADALTPLAALDDAGIEQKKREPDPEVVDEAIEFLQLDVRARFSLLAYGKEG